VFLGVKDVLARMRLYVTMFLVLVVSVFILVVPQNIFHTVSARSFMTYLGVGESDMSVQLTQTRVPDVAQEAADIAAAFDQDEEVARFTVLAGMVFTMPTDDGVMERLRVDLGDHTAFPVAYSQGGPPTTGAQIALSSLNAEELGKTVGDEVTLIVDGADKRLTVCGVYSDITNAGKTAKAAFEAAGADLVRVVIPVELRDEAETARTASDYQERFPSAQVAVNGEYVRQTFGGTLDAIQKASYAAVAAAAALTVLVTLLFMKMLVVKDRHSIAILKSLGFTSRDVRRQFMTRSVAVAASGLAVGVVLANTLGEMVGGALISSLGATTFHFVVDPVYAYLFAPALIGVCVWAATLLGVRGVGRLEISEHIKEA
jgi:putative ABC transport system permease protein